MTYDEWKTRYQPKKKPGQEKFIYSDDNDLSVLNNYPANQIWMIYSDIMDDYYIKPIDSLSVFKEWKGAVITKYPWENEYISVEVEEEDL